LHPHAFRKAGHHGGIEQAGGDRDDPDRVIGELARDRERHPRNPRLGGAVRRLADLAVERGRGGGVDDDPLLALLIGFVLHHLLHGEANDVQGADQIDLKHPVEKVQRDRPFFRENLARIGDARAIDCRVDRSKSGHDLLHGRPAALVAGHVGMGEDHVRPQFGGQLLPPLLRDIENRNSRSGLGQASDT